MPLDLVEAFDKMYTRIRQQHALPPDIAEKTPEQPTEPSSLSDWLALVNAADSVVNVLALVGRFKGANWTDEQRSRMSGSYIRHIEVLRNRR